MPVGATFPKLVWTHPALLCSQPLAGIPALRERERQSNSGAILWLATDGFKDGVGLRQFGRGRTRLRLDGEGDSRAIDVH